MKTPLWFELDEKLFSEGVSRFKSTFLAKMNSGVLTDPYSSAIMELSESLLRYARSNYFKTFNTPALDEFKELFTSEQFEQIADLHGPIAAYRSACPKMLQAFQETDDLIRSLLITTSIDQHPSLERVLKDLGIECAAAVYMHERLNPIWFALDSVVEAVIEDFPHSPITGQALFDHFSPLPRLLNYYMLSGTQADLKAFFSKLETLLHSDRLTAIFVRENDGTNQRKIYLETVQKKIDQLEVTVLLGEVLK